MHSISYIHSLEKLSITASEEWKWLAQCNFYVTIFMELKYFSWTENTLQFKLQTDFGLFNDIISIS